MILLGVKLIILLLLQEGITTVGLAENPQKQDIGTVNVVLTLMGFLYIAPSCLNIQSHLKIRNFACTAS